MYLLFRNESEVTCEGMDCCWHKNHQEIGIRCNLNGVRRSPHDESKRPQPVTGKRKCHDRALAEPGTEVQDICHSFQCQIDTLDEWNSLESLLHAPHEAFTDYMIGHDSTDDEEADEKQQAYSRNGIRHVAANDIIERSEQCPENQHRRPCWDQDRESRKKPFPERRGHGELEDELECTRLAVINGRVV